MWSIFLHSPAGVCAVVNTCGCGAGRTLEQIGESIVSGSVALETRGPIHPAEVVRPVARPRKARGWAGRALRAIGGAGEDVVLLLLAGCLIPVAVLVFFAPVALVIGFLWDIAQRW
jgi:hypothetical protein